VGALLPTSKRAVSDMLDLAAVPEAGLIVEFGAGSGVYTHELLRRMGPDARLIAFEVDPSLVARIAAETDDPRLQLVAGSAEDVEQYLDGGTEVDILVSALPFTSLPGAVRQRVLDLSPKILAASGVMLVLQYSPFIQRELNRRFANVERRISPINVPPAFLFRCSQ
jgi:phospholipid N-methyltransferase